MIYFKSGKVDFDKAIKHLSKQQILMWGYILLYKREITIGKEFGTIEALVDDLRMKDFDNKKLNEAQIAFVGITQLGREMDKLPMPICKKPYLVKVGDMLKHDAFVAFGRVSYYDLGERLRSREVEYTENVLCSFNKDVLHNTIQFLGKYELFSNANFIICSKKTGFKFIGQFRDKEGVVFNGNIRNHKRLVYSDIF